MSTIEENMKSWEAYAAEKERLANLKNVVGGKVYMLFFNTISVIVIICEQVA